MKTKALLICMGLFCLASSKSKAQNEADALRYSYLTFGGTARFCSMGGAFGALGGDMSSLSFNPAGIGVYRKSELTFTPSLFYRSIESSYNGTSASDNKLNFNFGNFGLVGTFMIDEASTTGWVSANFGIGYNRTNNFNSRSIIQGTNLNNSLADQFLSTANGRPSSSLDPYSDGLAYNGFLIDTAANNPNQYTTLAPAGGLTQRKTTETSGSMSETVISFGGNYANKLFVGATLGIPSITYTESSSHQEDVLKDTLKYFKSFTYSQNLDTRTNIGINFKAGVIYRATEWLRIGAAIHTPTYFSLTDEYSTRLVTDFKTFSNPDYKKDVSSPAGSFDYNITTPMRAIGSIALIAGKKGLISADYEFVDYSSARINSNTAGLFVDVNSTIKSLYTTASNIRIGGEYRVNQFSLRGGYALYGSPYKNYADAQRNYYTAGVGVKGESFYADFAFVLGQSKAKSYLYDPSFVNAASQDVFSTSYMLTIGFRY